MITYGHRGLVCLIFVGAFVGTVHAVGAQEADVPRLQDGAAPQLHVVRGAGLSRLTLGDTRTLRVTEAVITRERLIAVPDSPTLLVTWEEAEGGISHPHYTLSLDGQQFISPRRTSYIVKLRHGDFEPVTEGQAVASLLHAGPECDLYIVQFEVQPLAEFRRALHALGATVHSHLAQHAHIVLMSAEVAEQVETLPYVRWVGPYHPAYRLEGPLLEALRGQAEPLDTRRYRIQVFEPGAGQQNVVADRISDMGGIVEVVSESGILLEATLTPVQLVQVVRMNEVLFIDQWSPPRAAMNNVRIVGGADQLESTAGYTGDGVRGEIMDDGCQTTHPDFIGRIAVRGGGAFPPESHGTATFGIVFGSGAGSANARGMLPDAFGYFNDWNLETTRYEDISQLVTYPYHCVFQSNSWGFAPTTQYTSATSNLDRAVFNFDIVILHSQGNEGTQQSVEHAWGKNVVGVGGVYHWNDSDTANDSWSNAGSIGPAADGRIKPDLCYYYDSIRTTAPINTYTNHMGGTSAACPETAGHFGLFFEMWGDGLFGNYVDPEGTVFTNRPHNSTARAIMIHTATQYPFSGTGHDLTRMHQGWGRPDVMNLYNMRNDLEVIDESVVLEELDFATFGRTVSAGEDELRATLVYTDIHGTTSSSQHRINDLTLKVTSPSAVVYWGNNGLEAGNWSTSGGSADTLNTIENVFVPNPEEGVWTVEVFADEINADGHVETPEEDVDFALVMSGGAGCPTPAITVPPLDTWACYGDNVVFTAEATDYNSVLWYKGDTLLPGETGLTLTIYDFAPEDEDYYRFVASNGCGSRWSRPATLAEHIPPALIIQPEPLKTQCTDTQVTFYIQSAGTGLSYVWRQDGEPLSNGGRISGADTPILQIDPMTADDVGSYTCYVADPCGRGEESDAGVLQMGDAVFVLQPEDTCGAEGGTAEFTAEATSLLTVEYQWFKDGSLIFDGGSYSGTQTNTLHVYNVSVGLLGMYKVAAFSPEPDDPYCPRYSEEVELRMAGYPECTKGDIDEDCDFDLSDMQLFTLCFGADVTVRPECDCANLNEGNNLIDIDDWDGLEAVLTGPQ